jgi:hypothetical protein
MFLDLLENSASYIPFFTVPTLKLDSHRRLALRLICRLFLYFQVFFLSRFLLSFLLSPMFLFLGCARVRLCSVSIFSSFATYYDLVTISMAIQMGIQAGGPPLIDRTSTSPLGTSMCRRPSKWPFDHASDPAEKNLVCLFFSSRCDVSVCLTRSVNSVNISWRLANS